MFSKHIPRWVLLGAALLACNAGFINALGYLGMFHEPVSHITGTVTRLSIELESGQLSAARHAGGMVVSFLMGCILCGSIISDSKLKLGRRYGMTLLLQSACLFLSLLLLSRHLAWSEYLVALACGLQNAMATSYSGAVVRTSHLTGLMTDIGIMLGNMLAFSRLDRETRLANLRKLRLLFSVLGGFFLGGLGGALAFQSMGMHGLVIPSVASLLFGLWYGIWKRHVASENPPPQKTALTSAPQSLSLDHGPQSHKSFQ